MKDDLSLAVRTIAEEMERHYARSFIEHGPTARGVDWGAVRDVHTRYERMLAVSTTSDGTTVPSPTLLDVGCGYGGLLGYALAHGRALHYTGIDLAKISLDHAKEQYPDAVFIPGDFLNHDFAATKFDYVVCNGILTQKLNASTLDMDVYARALIRKMFAICRYGIAFNVMSTFANYYAPNLYYKHPAELLTFCLSELSLNAKLDHSYGLFEYTIYVYR